jgi:hypothetical protein
MAVTGRRSPALVKRVASFCGLTACDEDYKCPGKFPLSYAALVWDASLMVHPSFQLHIPASVCARCAPW